MSLEEAARYALSEEADQPETPTAQDASAYDGPTENLTRREREVADLVARGLTHRQVVQELSISERTAANHIARILKKLGLGSRTQMAERGGR